MKGDLERWWSTGLFAAEGGQRRVQSAGGQGSSGRAARTGSKERAKSNSEFFFTFLSLFLVVFFRLAEHW